MTDDKFLIRFVIVTGIIVSSLISLTLIFAIAYFKIWKPEFPVPEVLTNWGGLIIGFYFGSFLGLVKDCLGVSLARTR